MCKHDFVGMNRQDDVRAFQTLIFVACQQHCDSKDGLSKLCVLSNHRQKKRDDVSRKRQCTRTRSCWVGRRERSSTPPASHVLNVDHSAFAKHVQNVFHSPRWLSDKRTCPRTNAGSKQSPRPAPQTSCARPKCVTDVDVFRTSPTSLLWNTIEFCRAPLPITIVQTHDAPQETPPTFIQLHRFCPHLFVLVLVTTKA